MFHILHPAYSVLSKNPWKTASNINTPYSASSCSTALPTRPDLIVKKFNSVRTCSRFYRSCKGARDLVEIIQPAWPLPCTTFGYDGKKRCGRGCYFPKIPLQFCRFKILEVGLCTDKFFKKFILPDVGQIGAINRLDVCVAFPEKNMRLLLAAAKPVSVFVSGHYDLLSPTFKDIEYLTVNNIMVEEKGYWTSTKIFDLMRYRRILWWRVYEINKEHISTFIANWLKGESTGSLKVLTYHCLVGMIQLKDFEELLKAVNGPNMKMTITEKEEIHLERDGGGKIEILLHFNMGLINFVFL